MTITIKNTLSLRSIAIATLGITATLAVPASLSATDAPGNTTATAASSLPPIKDVIMKARSQLGTEAKLNAVNSLRITADVFDDKNQKTETHVNTFKKPAFQRNDITRTDKSTATIATNGFEAWSISIDPSGKKSASIIAPPFLEQFISSSYDTLYFYEGPYMHRGADGVMTMEKYKDTPSYKVYFRYPSSLTYIRYFDASTGKELATTVLGDTNKNELIQSGTITQDGISFPASMQTFQNGKLVKTTKYTKIEVNPPIDDKIFAMPPASEMFQPSKPAPTAASPMGPPPNLPSASSGNASAKLNATGAGNTSGNSSIQFSLPAK